MTLLTKIFPRPTPLQKAAVIAAVTAITLGGCATPGATLVDEDPYEGFNRDVFAFNTGVDQAILKPVSEAWDAVAPEPVEKGVSNFTANLGEPSTFVNDVLQGEPERAMNTALRFLINSTLGLAGFIDIAGMEGIERHSEDFGQTLAVWGFDGGPFIVAPILGPTTPRDLAGFGIGQLLDPVDAVEFDGDDTFRTSTAIVGGINARAQIAPQLDALATQADPYTAVKRIWARNRNTEIANGRGAPEEPENLPDFDTMFGLDSE